MRRGVKTLETVSSRTQTERKRGCVSRKPTQTVLQVTPVRYE